MPPQPARISARFRGLVAGIPLAFHRSMRWKSGDRVIVRSEDWRVLQKTTFAECEAIDVASEDRDGMKRTFLLPFDIATRAPPRRPAVVTARRWCQAVAAAVAESFPFGGLRFCPSSIRLLPYQLEPALAIFRHGATRLLIADEVGLGKTVEAGLIVREVIGEGHIARVLILVPASLRDQWQHELASLFGIEAIAADAGWLQRSSGTLPADVNPWSLPGVYLASTDFVKRPEALHPLEAVRWDLLVQDEAHGATPGSHRRAAVHALACRARRVVLLTATPHAGDEHQFEELCGTGRVGERETLVCFRRSREDVHPLGEPVKRRVMRVQLTSAERAVHRELEAYCSRLWASSADRARSNPALLATILRKRALSSIGSLAQSLQRRLLLMDSPLPAAVQLWLPLEDDDRASMEDEASDEVLGGRGLGEVGEERRRIEGILEAAASIARAESKVLMLRRLLKRIREPAIVFSEYRDTVERLRRALAGDGHRVLVLHGGLGATERRAVVADFNRGGALLVATDAASEGLNLHHGCRLVVHFELPWTPMRLHQRCGRVNRIGQRRTVHEIALVANDTAEQMVIAPLVRREGRASRFSGGTLLARLSEEQVAAQVLAGTAVAPSSLESRMPEDVIGLDLRHEAEAERLGLLRRLRPLQYPGNDGRPLLPVARGRRSRIWTMTVLVTIREGTGALIEQETVAIAAVPRADDRLWPRAPRKELAEMVNRLGAEVAGRFRSRICSRLKEVAGMHARVRRSTHQRNTAIERQMRSAARELVQAGLFDRVPVRTADRRGLWHPDGDVSAAAGFEAAKSMLKARVRVSGVLCGSLE